MKKSLLIISCIFVTLCARGQTNTNFVAGYLGTSTNTNAIPYIKANGRGFDYTRSNNVSTNFFLRSFLSGPAFGPIQSNDLPSLGLTTNINVLSPGSTSSNWITNQLQFNRGALSNIVEQ